MSVPTLEGTGFKASNLLTFPFQEEVGQSIRHVKRQLRSAGDFYEHYAEWTGKKGSS